MEISRRLTVLDAPDLEAESAFWAAILGGEVERDDDWHTVLVDGRPELAVQLAPGLVAPDWPDGTPQQLHLDLWVTDIDAADREAVAAGARLLQDADHAADTGFVVYADPAGHPFCLCW